MGCLSVGLAALLALAVPASIAPASLVGAYVVLAVLAAAAAAAVVANARRPRAQRVDAVPRRARSLAVVAGLTVAYAAVVAVVHLAAG
ncbi:hypothetical protein [uncultured Jatrophihabitans sp.]|uniref:hypothetical protein n=1 Tax=uncultured Jatrophihabitans sp. TaxID=1610747 RepID=UPI0035CA7C24